MSEAEELRAFDPSKVVHVKNVWGELLKDNTESEVNTIPVVVIKCTIAGEEKELVINAIDVAGIIQTMAGSFAGITGAHIKLEAPIPVTSKKDITGNALLTRAIANAHKRIDDFEDQFDEMLKNLKEHLAKTVENSQTVTPESNPT